MDLQSYKPVNILFLRGCFVDDCDSIEDLFDARLLGETSEDAPFKSTEIVYDKIPSTFKNMGTWITSTNLLCWSCDCVFYSIPIFVPTAIKCGPSGTCSNHINIVDDMDTLGNFCSWNCASSYIDCNFKGSRKWEIHEFLKMLYTVFTKKTIPQITASCDKTTMVQYGGAKTRQEYRKMLETSNEKYKNALIHNKMAFIKK
jgi:hypothetical protein